MSYSKQVYDKAWATLTARRTLSRERAAARREEVRVLPRISEIERQMAAQAVSVAKLVIADPHNAEMRIKALAKGNLQLQYERAKTLEQAGYPPDYLDEKYDCERCLDTGYLGSKMCECMLAILRREAAGMFGRSSYMQGLTFEGFSLEYYEPNPDETGISPRERMRENLRVCKSWAEGFSLSSESMLLAGSTGVGKTHLSVAMATVVAGSGQSVAYASIQQMMDALEGEKFARDAITREKFLGASLAYLECDLLVLDDLGTEFSSQFTGAALFNILNVRLVEQRPTIISTNLELGEIRARYNQRMASRLIYGYKVLRFAGKDVRLAKKQQKKTNGSAT